MRDDVVELAGFGRPFEQVQLLEFDISRAPISRPSREPFVLESQRGQFRENGSADCCKPSGSDSLRCHNRVRARCIDWSAQGASQTERLAPQGDPRASAAAGDSGNSPHRIHFELLFQKVALAAAELPNAFVRITEIELNGFAFPCTVNGSRNENWLPNLAEFGS